MMKYVLPTIAFAVTLVSLGFGQEPTGAKATCPVSGNIIDLQGGLAANVGVLFHGRSGLKTSTSDISGRYAINLEPGIYEVKLSIGVNKAKYRRSKVSIDCKTKEVVNLILLPQCVSFGCDQTGFFFDYFTREPAAKQDVRAVIAYARKTKSDGRLTYERAVMTYNKVTISADRIEYDPVARTFLFTGSVYYDDGHTRVQYDRLRGALSTAELTFQVSQVDH
jgi:hypothetical protein